MVAALLKKKHQNVCKKPLSKGLKSFFVVLAFVGPYLLFFIAFSFAPTIMSLVISFLKWDYYTPAQWAGWDNYKIIFDSSTLTSQKYWSAVGNTMLFVAIEVPLLIVLPFFVAVLLNRKFAGQKFYRALIYFPAILSISTVAIIWLFMFDTNLGLLNKIFGVSLPWLTKQPYAWISIFLLSTWWGMGGNMTLFLAGLQGVPRDLYEACEVDGGNFWHKVLHVTLPCMGPTFAYVTIMTIISCFNVFGQPLMMTNGGPDSSTTVAIMYIYNVAFGSYKFGRASAMAIVLAGLMMFISIVAYILIRKGTDNGDEQQ
jgi:multiple sugar transport system permease protein